MKKIALLGMIIFAVTLVVALERFDNDAIKCDIETMQMTEKYYVPATMESCREEYRMNGTENISLGEVCRDVEYMEKKTRVVDVDVCKEGTKRIELRNTLEYEKEHLNCNINGNMIECDQSCYMLNGKRECGDGDGDGICEPGETCVQYPIVDNEIRAATEYNGKLVRGARK